LRGELSGLQSRWNNDGPVERRSVGLADGRAPWRVDHSPSRFDAEFI